MARDIRELFKDEKIEFEKMPDNHQDRFLEKLDKAFPESKKSRVNIYTIAASIVVLLGVSFVAYTFYNSGSANTIVAKIQPEELKTLGDVSPDLKKVEDYYLASINLELSKMNYTPETKDIFDGYLNQLNVLNEEYGKLSVELTENGPNELTVNALIDNLKFRLNLLYRLRAKLRELNVSESDPKEVNQSI